MAQPGLAGSLPPRIDVRLVPAALTCWAVTAGGIWWPIGRNLAWCGVVAIGASAALAWRALHHPGPGERLRTVSAGFAAIGEIGRAHV